MRKKICYGCQAFQNEQCYLGYEQTIERKGDIAPAGECPKPRTYRKLVELFIKGEENDK